MRMLAGIVCAICLAVSQAAWARPLGPIGRTVIPWNAMQIISIDYRELRRSDAAVAMRGQPLIEALREFEEDLRKVGIDPDTELTHLLYAMYPVQQATVRVIGVAEGTFRAGAVLRGLETRSVRPFTYRTAAVYPMSQQRDMTFLDEHTLLFAERGALRDSLNTRERLRPGLGADSQITGMIPDVAAAPIWSVLDRQATLNMIASLSGGAARVVDAAISRRLLGSRYTVDLSNGLTFDLDVLTSSPLVASAVSLLLKAGVAAMTIGAPPGERSVLGNVTVGVERSSARVRASADRTALVDLLHSRFLAPVSR